MKRAVLSAVVTLMSFTAAAVAQQGPPFNGGGTAFDPEVDTVFSGALLDAQVVVSHDRRYVTINTRTANTDLRDLVLFPVQESNIGPPLGFVGGLNPAGDSGIALAAAARGEGSNKPSAVDNAINRSPAAIANQGSILNRRGMFLLAALE